MPHGVSARPCAACTRPRLARSSARSAAPCFSLNDRWPSRRNLYRSNRPIGLDRVATSASKGESNLYEAVASSACYIAPKVRGTAATPRGTSCTAIGNLRSRPTAAAATTPAIIVIVATIAAGTGERYTVTEAATAARPETSSRAIRDSGHRTSGTACTGYTVAASTACISRIGQTSRAATISAAACAATTPRRTAACIIRAVLAITSRARRTTAAYRASRNTRNTTRKSQGANPRCR